MISNMTYFYWITKSKCHYDEEQLQNEVHSDYYIMYILINDVTLL